VFNRSATASLPLTTLALGVLVSLPGLVSAQDTLKVELPPIRVEASRGVFSESGAPTAIAVATRSDAERRREPALALANVLSELPGLWLADRSHLAIGERLVVRGLGSRAAFGVRSVAVLLDGVLLTMPDGQAVLDPIEPAMIARAELMRGPASRFWGNAAGGVLAIESGTFPESGRRTSARALGGSDGTLQLLAESSMRVGRTAVLGYGSVLDRTGYREHAAGSIARGGLRVQHALEAGAVLNLAINGSDLDTRSPGSLTLEQWEADPSAADARYINTKSGKRATQVQSSLGITAPLAGGILSGSVFGVKRSLDNPLPFAWIGVERLAGGARLDWRLDRDRFAVALAADGRVQSDDRINADNDGGARGSETSVDQRERVSGVGLAVTGDFQANAQTRLTASVRADRLTVSMDDHITGDGDESGSSSFSAVSPALGVVFQMGASTLFASVATAFEIPTTTELVNSPDGSSGFNENLSPQRLVGIEGGLRRTLGAVSLDVAVYGQQLTNFLSPYQLETFPGRTFYQNVGEVNYVGAEGATRFRSGSWTAEATLSMHRYTFASGDLDGNRVPGIPDLFGSVRLARTAHGLTGAVRVRFAGAQFANDANTVEIDGFVLADLRLAFERVVRQGIQLAPFLEVSNLFDGNHLISIIPNARGGRYYEGVPGRAIQIGAALTF
jgi:iron complex outermembrane receptor protein